MADGSSKPNVIPRIVPEGTVPIISVEGNAYECGSQYAQAVLENYPGYRQYLDPAHLWNEKLSPTVRKLYEKKAPHILEVFRGLAETAGPPKGAPEQPHGYPSGCTSFGVSGSLTLSGQPISGQTKDTPVERAYLYIALRMRIDEAPDILVVTYPGELLGYGFWSTGMSLFRNSLHSSQGGADGLTMPQWGLLALACRSAEEAVDIARKYGLKDAGNCLIGDAEGAFLSVEYNAGGVGVVPAKAGIATHANHPEGIETAPYEKYEPQSEAVNSRYRMHGLWNLLDNERGKITPQKALQALSDHGRYPQGICRHIVEGQQDNATTAAVVVEPTAGRLHVVRSNPCCNWPVTYEL